MNPIPLILAQGLLKQYQGQVVVNHIDFEVRPGECFGILGPNGAGKTTTLRMVIGLTPKDSGGLQLFGQPIQMENPDVCLRMGVVSQEDNLDDDLSVAENILVYGRFFGVERGVLLQRIDELLAFVQLSERCNQSVRTLSCGMKRRLVIARALVASPELLILDEPTTGLDPQARHMIWQRLGALKANGTTLLLTTHYMEEAYRLCDRLMIMDGGEILAMGEPAALICEHVEPEVVEIRGVNQPVQLQACRHLPGRLEMTGDALYCHTDNAGLVVELLQGRRDLVCVLRPANLEDVFLKLTGRELKD